MTGREVARPVRRRGGAARQSCMVWPWRIGSGSGEGFDCSGLRVARWVADRRLRALFCVARRSSVLAFLLVTPHRCWSAEVPGLHDAPMFVKRC